MRFEIGPGGGFVILVGLVGLSAAVFFLGMISGREMAESELGQNQLATVYPLPPAAPEASPSPAAETAAAPAAAAPAPSAAPARTVARPSTAPTRPKLASALPPGRAAPARTAETAASVAASSAAAQEARTGAEERAAAPPAAAHHRGYNIVIDAAMDRAGADKMASRLLALGYTPHIVSTAISGQTWYKVQVGPYPSEDDARAAQDQLRAAYTARYVNRASAGAAAAGGAAGAGSADSGASGSADTGTGGDTDSGGDDSGSAGPSD